MDGKANGGLLTIGASKGKNSVLELHYRESCGDSKNRRNLRI